MRLLFRVSDCSLRCNRLFVVKRIENSSKIALYASRQQGKKNLLQLSKNVLHAVVTMSHEYFFLSKVSVQVAQTKHVIRNAR